MNPEELFEHINKKLSQQQLEELDIEENYEPKIVCFEKWIKVFRIIACAIALVILITNIDRIDGAWYEIGLYWTFYFSLHLMDKVNCAWYALHLKQERLKMKSFKRGLDDK